MKLSVIMPVFNGEKYIVANTFRVEEVLKSYVSRKLIDDYEIIVVDDGSNDNTLKLLKENFKDNLKVIIVENVFNQGKGFAFKNGFFSSSGDVIVMIDSDLDIPPEQIENLITEFKNGYDVVITSKFEKGSKLRYPIIRKITSFAFYMIVKILFGLPFKDTQTGLKLFKKEVLETCLTRMVVKRFAFDLELIIIAYRYNFSIKSIPVTIDYHNLGNINLKTMIMSFIDTLAIFYRLKVIQFYDRPVFISKENLYNFYFVKDFETLEGINTSDKNISQLKNNDYIILRKYNPNNNIDLKVLSSIISSYNIDIINGSYLIKNDNLKEHIKSSILCSSIIQPFFSIIYRVVQPVVIPIPLSNFLCVSAKVFRYLLSKKTNLNNEEEVIINISQNYHSVLFISDWSTIYSFKDTKIFAEFIKRMKILIKTKNIGNLFFMGILISLLWLSAIALVFYNDFILGIPFIVFIFSYLLLKITISGIKHLIILPIYLSFSILTGIIGILSPLLVLFRNKI
ncbi:MAG: glycosyltransferase family 2 protein [Brevinematia bacterium]